MEEKYPKGTKGNPFYVLEYSFEKGILRLDPYPLIDERKTHGPRFILKDIWPVIMNGSLSREIPTSFLCIPSGPAGNLDFNRSDIIRLAKEVEGRQPFCKDTEYKLNAYLLHQPTFDPRLQLNKDELKEKDDDYYYHFVFPIQFFHIEVEVPKEMRDHAKILETLGV